MSKSLVTLILFFVQILLSKTYRTHKHQFNVISRLSTQLSLFFIGPELNFSIVTTTNYTGGVNPCHAVDYCFLYGFKSF